LSLEEVNWDVYKFIEKLAPYGQGNPKPVFLFENIEIKGIRSFGKTNNHLELIFENQSKKKVKAIGFFRHVRSFERPIEIGSSINLIATYEKSNFRNFPELRLRIVDIV